MMHASKQRPLHPPKITLLTIQRDTWELNFCVGNPGQFIHPEYVKESAANHVALSDCSESTGSTES